MKRAALAVAIAAGAVATTFAACSDVASSRPDVADAMSDATLDASPSDRDWYVEPAETGPEFNADGWIRIDYPNCNFYAAPTPDKMPAPLAWEDCPSIVAPLGITCRQIKFNWPPPTGGVTPSAGILGAWLDKLGKLRFAAGFTTGPSTVYLIADAEGPVRQAVSYTRGQCSITTAKVDNDKSIFMAVRPPTKTLPEERGAIGGEITKPPLPLEHWADGIGRSYYAGPVSYFALGPENAVRSWTPGAPPLGVVTLSDPGQMVPRLFVGEDLFYEVNNQSYGRINVYSPAKGARDLVSFGNDVSSRAVNFGTDGIDMVWVEAFGRASSSDPWKTIDIMTSKFTADSGAIQKRRLRSEISAVGLDPFVVGCGHAAHFVSSLAEGNIVRVVRLVDGHSWKLRPVYGDASGWVFLDPVALTCDEVFVRVNNSNQFNTARIRLDSLGPGEAAD